MLCGLTSVSEEISKSDIEYLVDRIFETLTSDPLEGCAYTVQTTDGDGNERRERYDPYFDNERAWSLVSINGAAPSAEQLDAYEPAKGPRHPAAISFDFIDDTTIKFVEQTPHELKFSFELSSELQFENEHSIENTLLIDPISAQINEIRRQSTETFKVGKFAKVFEFETIYKLEFEEETQSVVLVMSSVRLKARTGELVVDQFIQRNFSEFDCSTVRAEVPETHQEGSQPDRDQFFLEPRSPELDP